MMLRLWVLTSSLVIASFGADVDFSIEKSCYSEEESMKLIAVYTGTGTVTAVEWYYSGQSASNLLVLASTCDVFGGVPAGYPNISRMTFTCDVGNNTYTLKLSNLQKDEFEKSWGATFSLSAGISPDVQEKVLTLCLTTPSPTGPDPECIILAILSAVFGGLAFIILIVLIVAIWKGLGRNFLLVLDGTDIATFTIGIVLGIVVHTYDDCPNWATNLATAVIVISCIGIVCDIISILYIVFGPGVPTEDDLSMTPANTKKKTESFKSFEKEQLRLKIPQDPMNWNETQVEQWLNWAKNEFTLESLKVNNFKMPGSELCRMDMEKFLILAQHNKCDILWIHLDTMKKAGKKGASETRTAPRPQPSKPSQGALSDRKMPPIPVTDKAMHDSKGRGLSANFDDDDHPIAGVDTPDRRAGALEPVREKLEPVRGKPKKLKKNKVDEEKMMSSIQNCDNDFVFRIIGLYSFDIKRSLVWHTQLFR